jgi:hypothetical protein
MAKSAAYFLTTTGKGIGPVRLPDELTKFRFAAEYGLSDILPGIQITAESRSAILIKKRRLIEHRSAAAQILLAAAIYRPIALLPPDGEPVADHLAQLAQRIIELRSGMDHIIPDYDHPLSSMVRRLYAMAAIHDFDPADFGCRAAPSSTFTPPP